MKKVGWVLERRFTGAEIEEIRNFHRGRLGFAEQIKDEASAVTAKIMLDFFGQVDGDQWVGMSYYEDEDELNNHVAMMNNMPGAPYRAVKASFPGASKGIWWGYKIIVEGNAAAVADGVGSFKDDEKAASK